MSAEVQFDPKEIKDRAVANLVIPHVLEEVGIDPDTEPDTIVDDVTVGRLRAIIETAISETTRLTDAQGGKA